MILHFDTDPAWIEIVVKWAVEKPEIRRVSVFGSRVTGARTPKTPHKPMADLDLAIELTDGHENCWFDQSEWAHDLEALIPVEIDCQWYHPIETPKLANYVNKGSVVIFERPS